MSDCVAIVGSGPVGSALSIRLKKENPHLNVVVYEQRTARTRTQKVRLNPKVLPDYLQTSKIEVISVLEERWIERAKGLGVIFITGTKITVSNLPLAKYVVLATGSKCEIRDELFGPPRSIHKPKTVVVCSYTSLTPPRQELSKTELLSLMTIFGGIVRERVNVDSHEVTLFWEIAEDEAESTVKTISNQLKSYTSNLVDLVIDKGSEWATAVTSTQRELYRSRLKVWLNYRNDMFAGDLHWSVYRSTLFSMDHFVKRFNSHSLIRQNNTVVLSNNNGVVLSNNNGAVLSNNNTDIKDRDNDDTTVYLIGDCAIGVPYFRSLQHGLENVTKFTFNKDLYQLRMLASAAKESTVAMTKSTVLDMASVGLKINRFNPIRIVKIPTDNLRDYAGL